MADKERERAYLRRFLEAVADCPQGPVEDSEAPDFLVGTIGEIVGIEFTVFRIAPPVGHPHPEEQQSLRWRIAKRAQERYRANGGGPLYVTVRFRDRVPLEKNRVQDVAGQIADGVAGAGYPGTFWDGSIDVPHLFLPSEIVSIQVRAALPDDDGLWHPTSGGWVQTVQPEQIALVIDGKNPKVAMYRKKAERVWLVLVNDAFKGGIPVELGEVAANSTYRYEFDRVYWMNESGRAAFRLRST